jgi:hypothetical protein
MALTSVWSPLRGVEWRRCRGLPAGSRSTSTAHHVEGGLAGTCTASLFFQIAGLVMSDDDRGALAMERASSVG